VKSCAVYVWVGDREGAYGGGARTVVAWLPMARRTVQLRVGGQTYRVVTSASDDELQRLAAVVDEKLSTVSPPGRTLTPQAMLLAAMALAHELEEERARVAALTGHYKKAVGRILDRVDAALASSNEPEVSGDGASDRGQ
jgi:cell division protein ZapA